MLWARYRSESSLLAVLFAGDIVLRVAIREFTRRTVAGIWIGGGGGCVWYMGQLQLELAAHWNVLGVYLHPFCFYCFFS